MRENRAEKKMRDFFFTDYIRNTVVTGANSLLVRYVWSFLPCWLSESYV